MRSHAKASSAGSTTRQATGLGRNRIAFACLLALLAFSGIGASSAMAGQTRLVEPFSPLDGTGSGVTIHRPSGIAIDQSTGNVFVTDENGSSDAILILNGEGEGAAPVGLEDNGSGEYKITGVTTSTSAQGLAYDNSESSAKGTLYFFQPGSIKKFTRNEVTEKYEAAGEILAAGTSGAAGLTVDGEGNVYLGDFGSQKVRVWSPAGALLHEYNFALSPTNRPSGLAVDSESNLYVQRQGGGGVYRYPDNGSGEIEVSNPEVLTTASSFGVAYDPVTDHVFVTQAQRVLEYDAATLDVIAEYGAGTLDNNTERLAVNSSSGRVYVADRTSGKLNVAVFSSLVPIPDVTTQAASEVLGTTATLNGVVNPQEVEVTTCEFEYGLTTAYGETAPCEGALPTDSKNHSVSAAITALEPNGTTYHFRLVVDSENGEVKGGDRTLVTGDTVFTEPATEIDATTATLNGTVRPEGEPLTGCVFEYGTAKDYGQTVPCSPAFGEIPDDFDAHALTGGLTELDPNTTYHFRLAATNEAGTVHGEDRTFTTIGPPQIVEQRPIDVTRTSATLQARINPSGLPTDYHFEFGTDTGYGTRLPADIEANLAAGEDPVAVKAFRKNLQQQSVYWFRVVASNPKGTVVGPDQRLETLNENNLPSNRAFELVTPADKGTSGSIAGDVSGQQIAQASTDGEAFLYPLTNGLDSSTVGGWLRQLAGRTESGWLSTQISGPSFIPAPGGGGERELPSRFLYLSPDNSCGFLESYNPLTPDTPDASVELGVSNLYRWSADGSYELITKELPLNPEQSESGYLYEDVDASDDCSRVYFTPVVYEFLPEASGLYEGAEGELRDAGVLPSGEVGAPLQTFGAQVGPAVLGGQVAVGHPSPGTARWNAASADGSRVFFTALADEGPGAGKPAVFMREIDGGSATVTEVSRSETGVAANGARFEAASADGGTAIFRANYGLDAEDTSGATPTNGACGPRNSESDNAPQGPKLETGPCDLYAYDVDSGELTDLSASTNPDNPIGAAIQGAVAVDDDGSHVYFAALGQLVPGEGKTYAENIVGIGEWKGSANVYLATDEGLSYVTTLAEHGDGPNEETATTTGDLLGEGGDGALMRRARRWGAETTANGSKLLFVSSLNLTGWESGGIDRYAAYLYSAGTGKLTCVSCRPDGLPSIALSEKSFPFGEEAQSAWLLPNWGGKSDYRPRSMSEDGSRVFFTSPDPLAPGAEVGKRNVYEWHSGQVSHLAVAEPAGANGVREFLDMSVDGEDVFFGTGEQLTPFDRDSISDVYNARIGGGFPFNEPAPECQVNDTVPLKPNQTYCQDVSSPQPDQENSSTQAFSGQGNVKQVTLSPCVKPARRAQALSRQAKGLRRKAKGASNRNAATRYTNRARRAAKAARRNSRAAKRCRRRARAANFDRGGAR